MKKITLVLTVMIMLVAMVVFTGCGEKEEEGPKTIKIGAAMADASDKWLSYLEDGVREFDAEYDDVEVLMADGKADPAVQLNSVETLLTQQVDAIVIVPVDISAMGPVIAKCKEANTPLIVVNRLPEEKFLGDVDVYVGSESIQAGLMQGEWVKEALGAAGGKVGILTGRSGHEAAIMRTQGNKDIFEGTNIEVVIEAEGKWDRALGMTISENWFQAQSELVAIVANNDEMAIGAVLAAKSMGIADEDIIIAGVDATPDALEYLGKGLDVTVFQSAGGQGYGGCEAAYKLIKGEKLEKMQWIPYELVTIDNMADYK